MPFSRFPTAITASLVGIGVLLPATQPWQGWSLPAEPELQPLMVEGQQANPADFSPEELQELQRRFGVHGPQPALAQLFTAGLDQWQPLRRNTLEQIESLVPTIRREARERTLNPMLLGAILYDEIQHAKPGENSPWLAHSGLLQTHGPAQLGGSMGLQQAGMRQPGGVFAWLGMLNFVVKDGPQQHRVKGAFPGLTADGGHEAFNLLERVAP